MNPDLIPEIVECFQDMRDEEDGLAAWDRLLDYEVYQKMAVPAPRAVMERAIASLWGVIVALELPVEKDDGPRLLRQVSRKLWELASEAERQAATGRSGGDKRERRK